MSGYLRLIQEVTGTRDVVVAARIEEDMRFIVGHGNPGTLDHLDHAEFTAVANQAVKEMS